MSKTVENPSMAQWITGAISRSGISQKDLAKQMGYPNPNVITMFKSGQTKLPIYKVPSAARAMGEDPAVATMNALREYLPEVAQVIQDELTQLSLTEGEVKIINFLRTHANGVAISVSQGEEADALLKFVELSKKKFGFTEDEVAYDGSLAKDRELNK